jgi:hypothetical protein
VPTIGDPERQPVKALPLMAVLDLPAFPFGTAFGCGVSVPGVPWLSAPGVCGAVPGCSGVVLGVCGAVLGVEVCAPAVVPLCWSELGLEGDVLLGCVWAATQIAESSNNENNVAFDFMAVSHLFLDTMPFHQEL